MPVLVTFVRIAAFHEVFTTDGTDDTDKSLTLESISHPCNPCNPW
jgi:hypothetical protein